MEWGGGGGAWYCVAYTTHMLGNIALMHSRAKDNFVIQINHQACLDVEMEQGNAISQAHAVRVEAGTRARRHPCGINSFGTRARRSSFSPNHERR